MKLKMIFMLNRAISLCKRLHGGYQGYSEFVRLMGRLLDVRVCPRLFSSYNSLAGNFPEKLRCQRSNGL